MNKKNTGATLGVLVAVSVGATAYASAMNNLDNDIYSKTLLENKVSYVEPQYKAKLNTVKADYTKDVENTKIGESKKEVAVSETEKSATLYEATQEVDAEASEENVEEENEAPAQEETPTEAEKKEEVEEVAEEEPSQSEEDFDNEDYLSNNTVEASEEEQAPVVEEEKEEVVSTYAEKYVGVEYLNVRKEASSDAQILTTIKAGDKVSGNIQGEWLKSDLGYINLDFLQDTYPQELVDQIEAKRAEEAQRKAEEEKKAQEEAQRKAEAEKKAKEEAQRKAEEEKKAKKEAQRKAQEEKKAKEQAQKKAQEEKKNQAVAYAGWVNTPGLNIRSSASTSGKILGNLTKGDKISGTLQNGWLKFTFNGKEAYVSGSYVVDYEVKKVAPVKEEKKENTQAQTQQNQQKQEAPQANNNQQAQQAVTNGNGQSAASIAQQFAGYPYVFGASDPSTGFDCSGLVHYAYRQIGVNLARNSAAQFSNGYAVDANNLVPGDLVFFSYGGSIDHVGIVTGYDGTFIHASTPGTGVVYGNVFSSHYQSVFRGARRIF